MKQNLTFNFLTAFFVIAVWIQSVSPASSNSLIIDSKIVQNVTGTVTDADAGGSGIPGVSVVIKGTNRGTTTDASGKFTLNDVNSNNTLVFSAVGYETQEVSVGNRSQINVGLKVDVKSLGEVVVVGYGTQTKATVTGAVVQVKGENLIKSPTQDMGSSLAGRLPGLVVIQTSGEPGADAARISIRGTNTLGNNSPLIVIDGIPDRDGGLSRLNPRDIENISVLKDASAAIYGARAANGAIIVTTKKGKSGKPTITYDFNQGFSQPTRVPDMSSSPEYAAIMNELPIYKTIPAGEWTAASNSIKTTGSYKSPTAGVSQLNANYNPTALAKYADGSDPWGFPNTDWFGDAFETWAGQSRHNLTISGGTENVKYFTSIGTNAQNAIYKNSATNFHQYNLRTNLTANVNKYITANVGLMVRREQRRYPTESAGAIFRMLMRGRPTEPEVWPNGKPGPDIENGQNPYVITTNATGYQDNPTDYIQANGSVTISNPWVAGLNLTLTGSADKNNQRKKTWQTPWMLYYLDGTGKDANGDPNLKGSIRSNFTDPRLRQESSSVFNTNLTAMLNYDKKIGTNNNLGLMVGVTKEQFEGENFYAYRRNYISSALDQLFAGGSIGQDVGGSAYNRARLGYYGRAQYNYKEKYLVEMIGRYDGSYIFPESGRFGFFPGILAGWNITNEPFFKVKGIDYLKLRASYGQMGNDQVAFDRNDNGRIDDGELQEYAFLSSYGFGQFPIDAQVKSSLKETVLANPNFTWERATNYNIGLDGTFLNGAIDLTLEYFLNKRTDILIQKTGSTPNSSGINALLPPVNAGKVDNRGFEFNAGYNFKASRDFKFRIAVNGGYAKNKVVYMDEVPGIPAYQKKEGKPIFGYLVYESDGAFLNTAEIDANKLDYSAVTGKLLPGDMKFKDINGDGKINSDDRTRLDKNATPTFNFGSTFDVSYKNFDLSALFQGATGALVRFQTESGDIGNFTKFDYDNRWSIDKPSSTYPRLASRGDTYYTGGNFGQNTLYLLSKNYIRLKNVELAYNVPASVLSKAKLGALRIYVNGINLFTIDKNKVFDPEAEAGNGVYYPLSRVVNGGFTLSF
jgi:TonB-dependent starch-binding outer membrane protein SusC